MVSPCPACRVTKLQRQNRTRAIQRQQIAAIKGDSQVNTINQARNCCEKIIFFNGRGHQIALGSMGLVSPCQSTKLQHQKQTCSILARRLSAIKGVN